MSEILSFNVQGEFITNLAREQFYLERRPFEKVKELLLSCMCGTDIPKQTLEGYVEDILRYKRKFVGETKDNTFCLVEENRVAPTITKDYESIKKYGKIPFEICEYGFINPQGKYIPVEWCKHGRWALDFLKENFEEDEWIIMMLDEKQNLTRKTYSEPTDVLVYKLNWILIDNPQQGEGIIHLGNRITKYQKETLYDYFMFFGRDKEASNLYKEDDEEEYSI